MMTSRMARFRRGLRSWQWWLWLGLAMLILFVPLPVGAVSPQERTFRIEASAYQYFPANIRVNPGDQVTIELVSTDVVHGIYIDGYDIQQSADPGHTERLSFIADQAGVFRIRCSVTCGSLHPFMAGKLVVGHNVMIWRLAGLALLALAAVFSNPLKAAQE